MTYDVGVPVAGALHVREIVPALCDAFSNERGALAHAPGVGAAPTVTSTSFEAALVQELLFA